MLLLLQWSLAGIIFIASFLIEKLFQLDIQSKVHHIIKLCTKEKSTPTNPYTSKKVNAFRVPPTQWLSHDPTGKSKECSTPWMGGRIITSDWTSVRCHQNTFVNIKVYKPSAEKSSKWANVNVNQRTASEEVMHAGMLVFLDTAQSGVHWHRSQLSMFLNAHSGITETKGNGQMETSNRYGTNLKSNFAKSSQGRVHSM